jgi:hypothetical protein
MKDGQSHYSEPKARVLDRASELRDVTIVGKNADGDVQIWSTLDQRTATEQFQKSDLFEPAG